MAHNFRTKEETARHNRRIRRQMLGAVLTVLMVVGLVTVVTSGWNGVKSLMDNTKEKQDFEKRLNSLVMLDPLPFGTLEQADPVVLKTAAFWASIATAQEKGTLDLYERDPDDMSLYLPAVDVDAAAAALYGPEYKIEHGTLQDESITFVYDEAKKAYKIPPTGQNGMYYPKVDSMKKKSGILRVTVGYVPTYTTDAFGLPTEGSPEKYMDYLFKKQDGKWYLAGLEESEKRPEKPASSSSQAMMDLNGNDMQNPQEILQQQTDSAISSEIPAEETAPQQTTETTENPTE